MEKNIAVIKGDGIGPEIVTEAMKVLDAVAKKYNHKFNYTEILMGGCSIDAYGVPLSDEALKIAKKSDSVLLGDIGGNTTTSPWYKLEPSLRPEAGLLKIRKELGLFANLRPAYLYDELKGACPLKEELTEGGFDMMIMRELTGGLYFGERSTEKEGDQMVAHDSMSYSESEIRRIAKRGFDIAMKRNKKICSSFICSFRFFKRSLINICSPGINHIHAILFQDLSYCKGQFQIVILFLAIFINSTRIFSTMSGIQNDFICHVLSP